MLEQPADNPFLERFYGDMPGYAFQTQLFFLFQRLRQMRELAQPGMFAPAMVSDFMFSREPLFARLNLSDEEYRIHAQLYAQLAPQTPQPDLVIWLQAQPATLLQRIRRRAIAMEQRIPTSYLQALCDAYVDHFRSYGLAPVLAVDTERFHPAASEDDFELLLARLRRLGQGRGTSIRTPRLRRLDAAQRPTGQARTVHFQRVVGTTVPWGDFMLFGKLLPREGNFFELFNQHGGYIVEGARAFMLMIEDYADSACARSTRTRSGTPNARPTGSRPR